MPSRGFWVTLENFNCKNFLKVQDRCKESDDFCPVNRMSVKFRGVQNAWYSAGKRKVEFRKKIVYFS
jgi:hypothetical protein